MDEEMGLTETAAKTPGRLIVVSGPSGSGKSTIVRCLIDDHPELLLRVSVSATTRAPRSGEEDGKHYFFMTPEEFESKRHDLLESATVHGYYYGTPAEPIRQSLAEGYSVILVIDVQGAFQVREKVSDALLIFIQIPGLEELEARLRARGTDADAVIQRRLGNARGELELAERYDYQVLNDDLDRAVEEIATIVAQNQHQSCTGTHS